MSATTETTSAVISENVRRLVRLVLGQEISLPSVATPTGPFLRRSNGLREFWRGIDPPPGLQILDLGQASQANISFITNRGYRLYTEDLLKAVLAFPTGEKASAERLEERFFRENLHHAEGQFAGILCWDLLDFMADPLVKPVVDRLHYFLRPGGNLLTFFHTGLTGQDVPVHQYRIGAEDSLEVIGRGAGKLRRHFNNRAIENLFRRFSSLKFYLSRNNLREVVIAR